MKRTDVQILFTVQFLAKLLGDFLTLGRIQFDLLDDFPFFSFLEGFKFFYKSFQLMVALFSGFRLALMLLFSILTSFSMYPGFR